MGVVRTGASTAQQGPSIPQVNLAALSAIADPNVHAVMQQLVDGWNTRNGATGSGSNAFVTFGDLGLSGSAAQTSGGGTANTLQAVSAGAMFLQPGVVTALLGQIQASIMSSPFFQSLGTSFNAPSGIKKQQQILSNSVGQLTSKITTLGASYGTLNAALQEEQSVRANADGELQAQYTVKVDVNGYVAGFGLASTANDAAPESEFYVRADAFAIASPSGPGISPAAPFVVYTTPQSVGGQTVQPGVYIARAVIANGIIDTAAIANAAITNAQIAAAAVGSAQIANAAIGTAHIQDAAVDTLTLAGQCVTVQASYSVSPDTIVNYVSSGGTLMFLVAKPLGSSGSTLSETLQLVVNGSPVVSMAGVGGVFTTCFGFATPAAGNVTIQPVAGAGGTVLLGVFEAKR